MPIPGCNIFDALRLADDKSALVETILMTGSENRETAKRSAGKRGAGRKLSSEPEWAAGLKKLYDSVVDEPLPDSFKDLLSKLDNGQS